MQNIVEDKLFLEKVCRIVRQAGKLVASFFDKKHELIGKNDGSFATNADIESEKFLIKNLLEILPGAGILAEESGGKEQNSKDYVWVIDPIDGTTNFAHGLPYFCVSVALTYKKEPLIGVVYDPLRDELFYGKTGEGAFLNGKQIKVASKLQDAKPLVSFVVPYHEEDCFEVEYLTIKVLKQSFFTLRKLGAAALDLAYVATGRLDVSVLKFVKWWDIAAGIVLVREAGGVVSEFDKNSVGANFSTCIAANEKLHEKFKKLVI